MGGAKLPVSIYIANKKEMEILMPIREIGLSRSCCQKYPHSLKAFKRDVLADSRQHSSVQDSTLGIRTWDSYCQIPDGSLQLTSWLTTVKSNFGLFYFIFVGDHNPQTVGHIRFHISCRILK